MERVIRKPKGSLVRVVKDAGASRTPGDDSSDLNDAPTYTDMVPDQELAELTINDRPTGRWSIKTTARGRQRIRRAN